MTAFAALLLSFIAPGAGHIFTGQYAEGLLLGVLFAFGKSVFLPLFLRLFKIADLKRTLQIFYACNLFYIALILYAAGSSLWRGFYAQNTHGWYAVLFALAVTLAYKNTFNAFIFTALCGRTEVYAWLRGKKNLPSEKK